jgi:hypothetical protein
MSMNANPFYFPFLNDPLIHDRYLMGLSLSELIFIEK